MTVLRLDPVEGTRIDGVLPVVERATLVRRDGGAFAEVAIADVGPIVRGLALAGIAAVPYESDLSVPRGLVAAIGRDLGPLPRDLLVCDIVRVRRLALGEATRDMLRRRFGSLLGPPATARHRATALLRGEDAVLAWDRRAWATRAALRRREARASLRAVVFDRAALDRIDLPGRTFASSGSIARWLFA